jgi:O-antigen ligase
VTETGLTLKTHVDNAHNEYLNYLVNIGAAGFAAYLSVIAVSLSSWLRKRRGTLIPALGCGLVCYWIQSFFGLGLCLVVPLVWIFMGLVNTPSEE